MFWDSARLKQKHEDVGNVGEQGGGGGGGEEEDDSVDDCSGSNDSLIRKFSNNSNNNLGNWATSPLGYAHTPSQFVSWHVSRAEGFP